MSTKDVNDVKDVDRKGVVLVVDNALKDRYRELITLARRRALTAQEEAEFRALLAKAKTLSRNLSHVRL